MKRLPLIFFIRSLKLLRCAELLKQSKQIFPSTADSIRLLNAYADGDKVLYTTLEDRLMKAARFFSRQKFMETVIAWAFIYF